MNPSVAALRAALLLFLFLAVLVAATPAPTALDVAVHEWLTAENPDGAAQWGDSPAEVWMDRAVFVALAGVTVAAAWRRASARLAFGLAASIALHEAAVAILKFVFARPRPPGAHAASGAFPSGHVATFTLVAILLVLFALPLLRFEASPRAEPARAMYPLALLVVAYAAFRLTSGEHWATDVIGSLLFSTAWALTTFILLRPWLAPRRLALQAPSLKPAPSVRGP